MRFSHVPIFVFFISVFQNQAAQFRSLGVDKISTAISADGKTVIGQQNLKGFYWQENTNILITDWFLGAIGTVDVPVVVSSNGAVCVGRNSQSYKWSPYFAFGGAIWSTFDHPVPVGGALWVGADIVGDQLGAVSGDGNCFVGCLGSQVVRWNRSTLAQTVVGDGFPISSAEEIFVLPMGISADGQIVASTRDHQAFYWSDNTGIVGLGFLTGATNSAALAVSGDGTTIVGASGNEAFLWRSTGGMVGLNDLSEGDFSSQANAVSADGGIVVGWGTTTNGHEAFIWDATNGMRNLRVVLQQYGLDLSGWTLTDATGISADGRTICGNGTGGAWVASLESRASDSDGTSHPDILVQSANQNSYLGIWNMAGTNLINSSVLNNGLPITAGWKVVGKGDFNHDNETDLLFQNGGTLTVWLMNQTNLVQSIRLNSSPIASAWTAIGVCDLNNDGNEDILFRHNKGYLSVWLMNGTNFVKSILLRGGTAVAPAWKCVGLDDFDKDGNIDILWQNGNTGQLSIWYMDGTRFKKSVPFLSPFQPAKAWQVAGLVDLNGDNNRDILWQKNTGDLCVSFLRGTDIAGSSFLNFTRPPNWNIVGQK